MGGRGRRAGREDTLSSFSRRWWWGDPEGGGGWEGRGRVAWAVDAAASSFSSSQASISSGSAVLQRPVIAAGNDARRGQEDTSEPRAKGALNGVLGVLPDLAALRRSPVLGLQRQGQLVAASHIPHLLGITTLGSGGRTRIVFASPW